MAIVAVRLKNMKAGESLDGEVSYGVTYEVITSSINDDGKIVKVAAGIPALGATYALGSSTDTSVKLRNKDATMKQRARTGGADRFIWEVDCQYTTKPLPGEPTDDGDSGTDPNNPTSDPPKYSGTFVTLNMGAFKDLNGREFKNSAGDPFEPAPEVMAYHPVLVIEKNFDDMGFTQAQSFVNHVNSDSYKGADPHTLLCRNIGFEPAQYQDSSGTTHTYYKYRIELEYNADKWVPLEIADMGFRERPNATDDPVPILKKGLPINTQSWLTASGKSSEVPHFIKFRIHGEVAFSGLGV